MIPLIDIISCCKENSPKDDHYYYFSIIYKRKDIYRVPSEKACKKWIETINSGVIYAKIFQKLSLKYQDTTEYLLKQKKDMVIINEKTGECQQYIKKEKNKTIANPLSKDAFPSFPQKTSTRKVKKLKISTNNLIDDSSVTRGISFNSFEILDLLGSGTFGKVFKVKLKFSSDNKVYAMKVINKKYLIKNGQLRYAITECNVLKQTDSPFIVKLAFSFQTADYLYMIIDYCPGGDLGSFLQDNLLEENEAKFYIAELICAIDHLHSYDIIYRDLKPENILIDENNHIKLADFGLAKENIQNDQLTSSFCGSPAYLSPEMISRKGVGKSADIYGIGAVLYEMISGTPPFYSNNISTLYENIQKSKLILSDYFSDEIKDLLLKLLCRDPNKRIGISNKDEIKSHPFFKEIDWEKVENKEYEPPIDFVELKKEENFDVPQNIKFHDTDYSDNNKYVRRVKNFTFIRKSD